MCLGATLSCAIVWAWQNIRRFELELKLLVTTVTSLPVSPGPFPFKIHTLFWLLEMQKDYNC